MKVGAAGSEVVDVVRRAKALVFDFDGTLVDSNSIKWQAFEICFANFPDRREQIIAYCRENNHTPRGDKFRYVYEQVLGLPYTLEVATMLHQRFAAETTHHIIEAPEIPGASQFLKAIKHSHLTALLSTTPHMTLLHILERRGWRPFFKVIRGAPINKVDRLQGLLRKRRLDKEEVVFFGDTPEDGRAAQAANCTFVAVANNLLALDAVYSIADFTRLLPH